MTGVMAEIFHIAYFYYKKTKVFQPAKKESTQELRSGYKTLHYWITISQLLCGLKPCYYKQIACFSNCYDIMKLTVLNYWKDRKFDRLSINIQLLTVNTLATAIIPKLPSEIIPSVKYFLFAIHVSDLIPVSRYKTLPLDLPNDLWAQFGKSEPKSPSRICVPIA